MLSNMKITKEQFQAYEEIRESGETNMFDVNRVVELSEGVLTKEMIMQIMDKYDALAQMRHDYDNDK